MAQATALATFAQRGGYSTEAPFVGGEVDLALTFGLHEAPIRYDQAF